MEDGILEIRVPKIEESKKKEVRSISRTDDRQRLTAAGHLEGDLLTSINGELRQTILLETLGGRNASNY